MRTFLLVFPLLASLLFTACGGEETAAVEQATMEATRTAQASAYAAMMEGHDRVMPMMSQLTSAERTVAETLDKGGLDKSRRDLLKAAQEQIEDAQDEMMDWMGGIKTLDELRSTMDNDAIMTYVKQEAADISGIEMDMKAAYANAMEILGSHADHDHVGGSHDHDHDH